MIFITSALCPPNSPDLNPVVSIYLDPKTASRPIPSPPPLFTTPCGVCFRGESIVPRSRTSTNWNDASSANGLLWVTRLLTVLLKRGVSVYALAFMLEADILSTRWNKDCVMWHVPQWLFWKTAIRLIIQMVTNAHLITALTAQSDTSYFPR